MGRRMHVEADDIFHLLGESRVGGALEGARPMPETNDKPKPFVWTKSTDGILAAVQRGRQVLEAIH